MAHLAAALPNHMMMEVLAAGRDVGFTTDMRIEDGWMVLGDAPGFGLPFNEETLEDLSVDYGSPETQRPPGRREGAGLYAGPP